ncbi:MAG: hypothetical protein Q9184_008463 [Pyrenodesmia sp. 2 TL-2023]
MFLSIYNVYERIQLIVFTLQELLISMLYIRAAFNIMLLPSPFPSPSSALSSSSSPRTPPPPSSSISTTNPYPPAPNNLANPSPFSFKTTHHPLPNRNTPQPQHQPHPLHRTRRSLLALNTLCIILDLAFVAQVYSGEWVYKTGTQSLAYAVKLTLEFVVLNQLVDVYRLRPSAATANIVTRARGERGGVGRKERGVEPLGPFGDEEEVVGGGMGMGEGSFTRVGLGDVGDGGGVEGRGKGIVVTTGIETWSERRSGVDGSRGEEEEKGEEVLVAAGGGGGRVDVVGVWRGR